MFEAILWGGVLRVIQASLAAAPTILVGVAVAGVFRRLIGHEGTRHLFGVGTWRALPQAWLIGMLLPVCSLGVIPVASEMRKAGIAGGTILAFAMTAPLFNPLSLLYGLTLSEPFVIFTFAMCSLMVVMVVGIAWDRLFPGTQQPETSPPAPVRQGWRRMIAVGVAAGRELASPSALYMLAGFAGVFLLNALLPPGQLQLVAEHDNPWAPLIMTGVAVPAYATPMLAMSQIGAMFTHANSIGAAFALLALGAGMNLGLIAWMFRGYGFVKSTAWIAILLTVVIGLAYAVENPLHPSDVEPAGHTHAFDVYCCPFHASAPNVFAKFTATLNEDVGTEQLYGLLALGAVLSLGLLLQIFNRRRRVEAWLEQSPVVERASGRFDIVVPELVLGGLALVGLVAFSVVGCYAYYPPKQEAFAEMSKIKTTVVACSISGNRKEAEHFLPLMDEWTRRMQVGVYLREGQLSDYQRMKTRIFLDKLELLEHQLAHDDAEASRKLAMSVDQAYRRMRNAYQID